MVENGKALSFINYLFFTQKGTDVYKDGPLILSEMIFDENTEIIKLMKAIHNP
jgi:hypothetical protein